MLPARLGPNACRCKITGGANYKGQVRVGVGADGLGAVPRVSMQSIAESLGETIGGQHADGRLYRAW